MHLCYRISAKIKLKKGFFNEETAAYKTYFIILYFNYKSQEFLSKNGEKEEREYKFFRILQFSESCRS